MNSRAGTVRVSLEVFDDSLLDLDRVREVLGEHEKSSEVASFTIDEESKRGQLAFQDTADWDPRVGEPPGLSSRESGERARLRHHWKQPSFLFATAWLQAKNPEQFQKLRDEEMYVAIDVENYSGLLPLEFLDQIVRHRLDLYCL